MSVSTVSRNLAQIASGTPVGFDIGKRENTSIRLYGYANIGVKKLLNARPDSIEGQWIALAIGKLGVAAVSLSHPGVRCARGVQWEFRFSLVWRH